MNARGISSCLGAGNVAGLGFALPRGRPGARRPVRLMEMKGLVAHDD